MLNTLKLESGFSVTVGADGAVEAMRNVQSATQGATASAAELKATLKEIDATSSAISSSYKSIKKELGGESATGENTEKVSVLKQKYIELTTAIETLRLKKDTASKEDIQNVYLLQGEMGKLLSITKEQIDLSKESPAQAEKDRADALRQTVALYSQIDKYIKGNTKIDGSDSYNELVSMRNQLQQVISGNAELNSVDLSRLKGQYAQITAGLRDAGKEGKSLGDVISSAYQKFGGWMLVTKSFGMLIRSMKDMVKNVKEIDSAMTELKKVTDETDAVYARFLDNAVVRAKAVGATVADTVNATADFARLGYSIAQADDGLNQARKRAASESSGGAG
jgi:hypothetical protein